MIKTVTCPLRLTGFMVVAIEGDESFKKMPLLIFRVGAAAEDAPPTGVAPVGVAAEDAMRDKVEHRDRRVLLLRRRQLKMHNKLNKLNGTGFGRKFLKAIKITPAS